MSPRRLDRARRILQSVSGEAGLHIDGDYPWDPQVHDNRFYARVLRDGSLGLGESYMDGWWDAEQLDETFFRLARVNPLNEIRPFGRTLTLSIAALANNMRLVRPSEVGKRHYDLGNELFEAMLGRGLVYTCAYWREASSLDEAQEAKLDLVCRKIGLREGDRVLDIGCGWGSFLGFAAERYGARGLGITFSQEQVSLARERLAGLPVEIRLQNYRALEEPERFEHVVSLGMFEHVGFKSYRTLMRIVHKHLKDGGLFLLQTIGNNHSTRRTEPWLSKYIFPGSMLPSIRQIGRAIEGLFVMEDWHNLSTDYDRTLMAWYANVEESWERLQAPYDERFRRMWRYYLLSCAGVFRARRTQLWQIVLAKTGVPGGYRSVR